MKIVIKDVRKLNGRLEISSDLLYNQVCKIIEDELLRRNILSDIRLDDEKGNEDLTYVF